MTRYYRDLIKKHYRGEAERHGKSLSSTMSDLNTRRLEITNLISYLRDGEKCLEIGCGNGSASLEISKVREIDLVCIDFSSDLITLAKKQQTKRVKGKVRFLEQDILTLDVKNAFDCIFTERCIINLLNWDDQKEALKNMARALRKGGKLILLEAFRDGLEELNNARKAIGLSPIPPAGHNLHLDKQLVIKYLIKEKLKLLEENNFLSTYYFGSRVLYPALAKAAKKEIIYNNAFVNFFVSLPSRGNYAHIKTLVFKK